MQVDLPALDRPTKAISGKSSTGRKCSCGAVVRNFAVCSHPAAMLAADLVLAAGGEAVTGAGGGFVFVVIDL